MKKIEPMQPDELLQPNQWAEMETWYLSESYQSRSGRYLLTFEVDEATWLHFKASVPKGSLVTQRFFYNDGDDNQEEVQESPEKPKREKKEPKPKGTYGRYWQAMFRHGALNHPGLREALKIPDEVIGEQAVKEALRGVFGFDSLTFIAPALFESYCNDGNHPVDLTSLITISRQCEAEAQQ